MPLIKSFILETEQKSALSYHRLISVDILPILQKRKLMHFIEILSYENVENKYCWYPYINLTHNKFYIHTIEKKVLSVEQAANQPRQPLLSPVGAGNLVFSLVFILRRCPEA